jgi:E3 ubiquitin-protein ligase RNF216
MQIMPLADPGSHQLPYTEPTPPPGLVPLVREPSPPVATLVSGVEQQPPEVLVQRVREVVPDVLPEHVFNLLDQHAHSDNILDLVIHTLLEGPSYPKNLKGKGKARAAKENPSEILGDVNTSKDYAILDANRSRGPVYRALCLVRLGASPRLFADVWRSEIPS